LESDTGVGIRHGCGVSDSAKKLRHGCPGNTDVMCNVAHISNASGSLGF